MKWLVIACLFVLGVSCCLSVLSPDKAKYVLSGQQPVPAEVVQIQTIPAYCVGHQDICDALIKAGFDPEQTRIMMAISGAEAHWRLDAKGDQSLMDSKWSYSTGCFQIRLLQHPGATWWRDPAFVEASLDNQAKAAHAISGGSNFTPWSTFEHGTYRQYLK